SNDEVPFRARHVGRRASRENGKIARLVLARWEAIVDRGARAALESARHRRGHKILHPQYAATADSDARNAATCRVKDSWNWTAGLRDRAPHLRVVQAAGSECPAHARERACRTGSGLPFVGKAASSPLSGDLRQTPRAAMTASPTFAPEYCCCPVMR